MLPLRVGWEQYDGLMGLCHEFGSQIRAGCDHPMRAGASACSCAECGVVCRGLFDGCPDVWARGPRPVAISVTRAGSANGAPTASAAPAALPPGPRPRIDEPRAARPVAAAAIGPVADNRSGRGQPPPSDADARADARADVGEGRAREREGAGDPRREVFRWFEEAFEGVRGELQALIASMTHQQAMLAELLDSRQAELRLALVAESLPDVVADAVREAMEGHAQALIGVEGRSHQDFRTEAEQIRVTTDRAVESLATSVRKLTDAIAVHDEEAEQRESVRLGALKGSVTRQVGPIVETLAALGDKVDALAAQVEAAAEATPASVPPPAAPRVPSRRAPVAAAPPPVPAKPEAAAAVGAQVASPPPTPRPATRRAATPAPPATVATGRIHRTDAAANDSPVVPQRVSTRRAAPPPPPSPPLPSPTPAPPPALPVATANGRRATVRAQRATFVPDQMVVAYELETADADDDWAPPGWVSESAPPEPETPAKPPPRATLTKSGAAKLAAKARAARPTRTSG